MMVTGGIRLPADLADLPGNAAVEALEAERPLTNDQLTLIIDTRMHSVKNHPTADRWFAVGRAYLLSGNPEKSRDAYAAGLLLDPARSAAWAGYARALARTGDSQRAAEARDYSIRRGRHDPDASRLRR